MKTKTEGGKTSVIVHNQELTCLERAYDILIEFGYKTDATGLEEQAKAAKEAQSALASVLNYITIPPALADTQA